MGSEATEEQITQTRRTPRRNHTKITTRLDRISSAGKTPVPPRAQNLNSITVQSKLDDSFDSSPFKPEELYNQTIVHKKDDEEILDISVDLQACNMCNRTFLPNILVCFY
jgi:hypothetical protein